MSSHPLGTTAPSSDTDHPAYESDVFGFVLLSCKEEPQRVGEVGLFVPFEETLGGRGMPGLKGFLRFGQHRPGAAPVLAPLEWALKGAKISREQFRATAQAMHIDMLVTGGCRTFVNDVEIAKGQSARLVEDDLVWLEDAALFLVVRRQRIMPALAHLTEVHPFGKANSFGTVGESPAAWRLQDELALAASRHNHVLLLGESGSGKEAAARAIHHRSPRAKRILNAMNAAAIASGIFEAEVFGSMANFPTAGMPAREGLLPVADDGTAFLDEVGGLSDADQTKLCRAMESAEYHKVGESRARRLTAIIVAATSADPSVLKLDFQKRFPRKIRVPPLRERKEDIALILRHLVLNEAERYPKEMARFLESGPDGEMVPRVKPELVAALVQHPLPGNVRDVYDFLLKALEESRGGNWIDCPRELAATVEQARSSKTPASSETPSVPAQSGRRAKCTKEEVVAALEKAGSVQGAALLLGVPRRTLRNWMVEYGLRAAEEVG
jgi:two-component system nitrogen regulation response regulator GlnG/two-component system response regulator HydG